MARAFLAFALGAAIVAAAVGSEFSGENIVHLTGSNFEDKMSENTVYFVKYYAPWCGHCKRLAPAWKELSDQYKDSTSIKIAHVDCTTDKQICSNAGIRGYPTLKAVYKGEEVKQFSGQRSVDALKTFIEDAAKSVLTESS